MKIFLIKLNKQTKWISWLEQLVGPLYEEASLSLKEEGATYEKWSVFKIGGRWYTVGTGDGTLPPNKEREVNKLHKEMKKDCFEKELNVDAFISIK